MNLFAYNCFLKIIKTKKTLFLLKKKQKISFKVKSNLTKTSIKNIIKNIFQVNVESINVCCYNKNINITKKNINKKGNSTFKKVYISLKNSHNIDKNKL